MTEAPAWFVSLISNKGKSAMYLVCSNGSENDVREIARCCMGPTWSTVTSDKTSMTGPAGRNLRLYTKRP